jgi:hypothetical protein
MKKMESSKNQANKYKFEEIIQRSEILGASKLKVFKNSHINIL